MKVLFVSLLPPHIAHEIPLLALDKMLADSSIETAFLAPRQEHAFLKRVGARPLALHHIGFRSEMMAYNQFAPDVVVDDTSITTGFTTTLANLPRITIQRTGMFPGAAPRNKNHRHSMVAADVKEVVKDVVRSIPNIASLALPQPQHFSDLFKAAIKIVPGIRSIEVLPQNLQDDPSYVFSGPLILDDHVVTRTGSSSHSYDLDISKDHSELTKFFEFNKDRTIVFVMFGTTAKANSTLLYCIRYLLQSDIAVVSNIHIEGVSTRQKELYYYQTFFPMHYVCSMVDLVIHHCGSATYHYPIIHNVPTISIGTKCYDRDDVAMRLEELGTSIYIPSPDEHSHFTEAFEAAIQNYFDGSGAFMRDKRKNTESLRQEIKQTVASFDFKAVLDRAKHGAQAK